MSTSGDKSLPRICIIGIGNVLLGDDGFGPLVVELFRCQYDCPPNVEILDLGTPGLDLTPYLLDAELVIIADAIHADEKPGTLCIYTEADLTEHRAQLHLTTHEPGVLESLRQLKLVSHGPSELIIVGVVPESCNQGDSFSLRVLSACSLVLDTIVRLLSERNIDCRRRSNALVPNLWWMSDDVAESAALSCSSQ
jgi:hydrogenase maturation protease